MTIVPTASTISSPDLRNAAGWPGLYQDLPAADWLRGNSGKMAAGTTISGAFRLHPIPRPGSISP
jgi:hypothetical protein